MLGQATTSTIERAAALAARRAADVWLAVEQHVAELQRLTAFTGSPISVRGIRCQFGRLLGAGYSDE